MNPGPETHLAAVPVWNVETLREYVLSLFRGMDSRLTERHESEDKAVNVAFTAQTTAMQAAFTAQKEAVTIAFLSQKEAVTAALAAADRAVIKAELASEKRFESVNEFRSTLADQQRTLMPRAEAEAIVKGLDSKLDSMSKVLTEKIEGLARAQVSNAALREGAKDGWQYAVAVIGLLFTVLGIFTFVMSRLH